MARHRSREAETEDVNQRRLRRGAVKRQHIGRWAVGSEQLAPGVVGDTHLHPTTIERIREEAFGASGHGIAIALGRDSAQTIPDGGGALELTDMVVGPRRAGFDAVTVPTTTVTMPSSCVVSVLVRFRWDDWRAGGTVRLMRGDVVVDESPASWGPRFAAVFHAGAVEADEALSVVVDHGDTVSHDVVDVRVAVRVEGASVGDTAGAPVGLYAVLWRPTDDYLAVWRYDETGTGVELGTAAPTSTGTSFTGLRASIVGGRIRARAWLWTDPEPATWDLDITDPDPLGPGMVGVTSTLTGSIGDPGNYREYDTLTVELDGAPAEATDFSEYADGSLPTEWVPLLGSGVSGWEIATGGGSYTGGKLLRYPLQSPGVGSYIGWTAAGAGSDADVVLRARPGEVNTTVGLVLRGNVLL